MYFMALCLAAVACMVLSAVALMKHVNGFYRTTTIASFTFGFSIVVGSILEVASFDRCLKDVGLPIAAVASMFIGRILHDTFVAQPTSRTKE